MPGKAAGFQAAQAHWEKNGQPNDILPPRGKKKRLQHMLQRQQQKSKHAMKRAILASKRTPSRIILSIFLAALAISLVIGSWCFVLMYLQKLALFQGRQGLSMSLLRKVNYRDMNLPGSFWSMAQLFPRANTTITKDDLLSFETKFLRARDPVTKQPRNEELPTLVFFHGNASTIYNIMATSNLSQYRENGMHVCLMEYRGYGCTVGMPSEIGIVSDMVKGIKLLRKCRLVKSSRLAYHGFSLGGGVVGALCRFEKPYAMILESTFQSGVQVAKSMALPTFLMSDKFLTDKALEKYCTWPTMVLHGATDNLLPPYHAKALYAAVQHGHTANKAPSAIQKQSRLLFYDRGHYMEPFSCNYWKDVIGFMKEVGLMPASAAPIQAGSELIIPLKASSTVPKAMPVKPPRPAKRISLLQHPQNHLPAITPFRLSENKAALQDVMEHATPKRKRLGPKPKLKKQLRR